MHVNWINFGWTANEGGLLYLIVWGCISRKFWSPSRDLNVVVNPNSCTKVKSVYPFSGIPVRLINRLPFSSWSLQSFAVEFKILEMKHHWQTEFSDIYCGGVFQSFVWKVHLCGSGRLCPMSKQNCSNCCVLFAAVCPAYHPSHPHCCVLHMVSTCARFCLLTLTQGELAAAPPQQMWLSHWWTPSREQCYWFLSNGPFNFHLFFSFQRLAFSYYCSHGPISEQAQYL